MTQEKRDELNNFYAGCLMAEAGDYLFFFTDEEEHDVVTEFNEIHADIRKNHIGKISVKVNQASNEIKFTVAAKELFIPKVVEVVEVEPQEWGPANLDLPAEDCETPEDCEEGCGGDCKDGFDGENLT
jgi:hypothetical protein